MARKLRHIAALFLLPLVVAATALVGMHPAFASPAAQTGPQNWTVMVSADSPDMSVMNMSFYPAQLTIHAGDTVTWMANSMDVHNVLFGPPDALQAPPNLPPDANGMSQVNPLVLFPSGGASFDGTGTAGSGLITTSTEAPAVTSYKLTFPKAGVYNYVCNFHAPAMVGAITVVDAATALPMTPDQALQAGKDKMASDMSAALGEVNSIQPPANVTNADGTTTWNVDISENTPGIDYMRFTPGELSVHVGDKVTWTIKDAGTPHTVTLASGGAEPDLFVANPQPAGPPLVYFNAVVLNKQGGDVYDGTGLLNSGIMFGTQVPVPGPRSYTLTFTQPGTYEFYCVLHDNMEMKGHVTVLAAGGTPGMPRTGSPSQPFEGLYLVLVLLAAGLATLGIYVRRSSAR